MSKTVLIQTIQFSKSTQFRSILPIDRTLSGATTPEWTLERWKWKSVLHSPKLLHYCNLTIRLFIVISQPFVGMSYPCVEMQSVYSTATNRLGKWKLWLTGWLSWFILMYKNCKEHAIVSPQQQRPLIYLNITAIWWLVLRYFRYGGSIKDAESREAEVETEALWRMSVNKRSTSVVTPTARDL